MEKITDLRGFFDHHFGGLVPDWNGGKQPLDSIPDDALPMFAEAALVQQSLSEKDKDLLRDLIVN